MQTHTDSHCLSEKCPSGSQRKCFEERVYYHVTVGKGAKLKDPLQFFGGGLCLFAWLICFAFCGFFVVFLKSVFSENKDI